MIQSTDSPPAKFYGVSKIHKVNVFPKEDHLTLDIAMRPLNPCIGSLTYSLSKYLAKLLTCQKFKDENTVKKVLQSL